MTGGMAEYKGAIMDTITTRTRTDMQLKREADRPFADLGMDFPTAVDMFPRQAVREQGLPFRPTRDVPNAETLAAMREADRIAGDPDARGFASVDELFAALSDEDDSLVTDAPEELRREVDASGNTEQAEAARSDSRRDHAEVWPWRTT